MWKVLLPSPEGSLSKGIRGPGPLSWDTTKKKIPIKSVKGLFEPDPSQPVVLFFKPELSLDVQLDVLALVCCAWFDQD